MAPRSASCTAIQNSISTTRLSSPARQETCVGLRSQGQASGVWIQVHRGSIQRSHSHAGRSVGPPRRARARGSRRPAQETLGAGPLRAAHAGRVPPPRHGKACGVPAAGSATGTARPCGSHRASGTSAAGSRRASSAGVCPSTVCRAGAGGHQFSRTLRRGWRAAPRCGLGSGLVGPAVASGASITGGSPGFRPPASRGLPQPSAGRPRALRPMRSGAPAPVQVA